MHLVVYDKNNIFNIPIVVTIVQGTKQFLSPSPSTAKSGDAGHKCDTSLESPAQNTYVGKVSDRSDHAYDFYRHLSEKSAKKRGFTCINIRYCRGPCRLLFVNMGSLLRIPNTDQRKDR